MATSERQSHMKLLLILVALHTGPHNSVAHRVDGIAKYYSPGVMEHVLRVRHMRWPLHVSGLASRVSCSTIGRIFYARINGHYERLLQVDCSQYRDAPRHIREGLVVEVDYRTALRDGITGEGRGPATVWP